MQQISEATVSDTELLAAFCENGDQAAFAQLVERYQPMVRRVCRQVTGESGEAEDAAQQVFIALSLKAVELQSHPAIASWMYRVAFNIASKFRRARITRQQHEQSAGGLMAQKNPASAPEPDTGWILQQVLGELPDIYREAIVLHYFCGCTAAQTAVRLRCPTGTAAARISRRIDLLRCRLADRDLILTVIAVKALLMGLSAVPKSAAAAVPAAVAGSYRPSPTGLFRRGGRQLSWAPAMGAMLSAFLPISAFGLILRQPAKAASSVKPWAGVIRLGWLSDTLLSPLKLAKPVLCIVIGLVGAGAGTIASKTVAPMIADKLAGLIAAANTSGQTQPRSAQQTDAHASHDSYAVGGAQLSESAVPEPGMGVMMLGSGILWLSRRRDRSLAHRSR